MDEQEVVDGWNEFEGSVSVAFDELVGDGEESFDAQLVEIGFHFQFPVVGDAHGIPECLGANVAHR